MFRVAPRSLSSACSSLLRSQHHHHHHQHYHHLSHRRAVTPTLSLVGTQVPSVAPVVSKRTMSSVFPVWDKPVAESRGDYREEAEIEECVGGPLYQHQKTLPRLPVPALSDTLERFLPSALPLARDDTEKENLLRAAGSFVEQAAVLQQRLEARKDSKENADSSWLQHWWGIEGYLKPRDPVVINVSYFFHFSDDSTLPVATNGTAAPNVMRGAAIMTAVAEFRKDVCSGALPAETVGRKTKTTLCSTAFKYMFHSCRVPRKDQDTYRLYDPSRYNHCLVARKGHFFVVDFCDPTTAEPYSMDILESSLQACIDMADAAGPALELGYLTSDNRDLCAAARAALIQAGGPRMETCLERLESGAFLLCLDDEVSVW